MDYIFETPQAVVSSLSFCAATKPGIRQWAEQLPLADVGKTSQQLYMALNELCQLKATAQLRFELIESLTPAITVAQTGLQKHVLNHPVILPERIQKVADLSLVFQQRLALIYLSIIQEAANAKLSKLFPKRRTLLKSAITRALVVYNQIFTNNFALYRPIPENSWLHTHKLYQVYLDKLASDGPDATIEQHYNEALLWGSLRANQLRQQDILQLQNFLPLWAPLLAVSEQPLDSGFAIAKNLDSPPIQHALIQANQPVTLYFSTEDVLKELTSLQASNKQPLSDNLIQHLLLAWGEYSERTFLRIETDNTLFLSIGLCNSHHQISGEKDFAELIFGTDSDVEQYILAADFDKKRRQPDYSNNANDAWGEHNIKQEKLTSFDKTEIELELIDYHICRDPGSTSLQQKSNSERYHSYQAQTINMSANGYCLQWHKAASTNVSAGEIVAVKSEPLAPWHLGAIRWVEQVVNGPQTLQMGVELLSPNAEAFAAYITNHQGHALSDFIRVLKLPNVTSLGGPTLITPGVSFQAGQKIHLVKNGKEQLLKLEKMLFSTGNYRQFSYKVLEPLAKSLSSVNIGNSETKASDNEDFDDVWKTLK